MNMSLKEILFPDNIGVTKHFQSSVMNLLRVEGIDTVGALLKMSEQKLFAFPNMGKTKIAYIVERLNDHGLVMNQDHIAEYTHTDGVRYLMYNPSKRGGDYTLRVETPVCGLPGKLAVSVIFLSKDQADGWIEYNNAISEQQ